MRRFILNKIVVSLYLIRHLPTAWNIENKLQGSKDIAISPPDNDTITVINANLKKISNIYFDEVLISELIRTKETATLYGYDRAKVEPLINELNFGVFEGQPKENLLEEIGQDWYENATTVVLGESLENFQSRINQFIEAYNEKTVLVFAHGAVIRAILAIKKERSIDRMNKVHIENNTLTIID